METNVDSFVNFSPFDDNFFNIVILTYQKSTSVLSCLHVRKYANQSDGTTDKCI